MKVKLDPSEDLRRLPARVSFYTNLLRFRGITVETAVRMLPLSSEQFMASSSKWLRSAALQAENTGSIPVEATIDFDARDQFLVVFDAL